MVSDRQKRFFSLMHRFGRLRICYRMTTLSQGEFMMLGTIKREMENSREEGGRSGARLSEVTQFLGGTKSATSKMLRSLDEKGFIERKLSSGDRRQISVFLTGAGEEALSKTQRSLDRLADRIIRRMGEKDMDSLLNLLEKLQKITEEELKTRKFMEEREEENGQNS